MASTKNYFNDYSQNMAAGPPAPDMQDCILGRCGSRVYNLNECLLLRDSLGQDGLGLSLGFLHAFDHSAGAARYAHALRHLD